MIPENCFTDELGGKVLISSLAQLLTSTLGMRCDENLATSLLRQPQKIKIRQLLRRVKRQLMIS